MLLDISIPSLPCVFTVMNVTHANNSTERPVVVESPLMLGFPAAKLRMLEGRNKNGCVPS